MSWSLSQWSGLNKQLKCTMSLYSPPALMMFNESTSLKVVLEYNTEYNVSIEVVISCGSSTAGFATLNYGEAYCSYIAHNKQMFVLFTVFCSLVC